MLKQVHGVVTGLAIQAQEADRLDAVMIADVLKGKTKQDVFTPAGVHRREGMSQGLTTMIYQEEADLVERPVLGTKSSGAWIVPHSCRTIFTLKDGGVTDA